MRRCSRASCGTELSLSASSRTRPPEGSPWFAGQQGPVQYEGTYDPQYEPDPQTFAEYQRYQRFAAHEAQEAQAAREA
ncbi:hypothetical protein ADL27_25470, partial [Streptomyces sp. NRRL F-6602]